MHRPQYDIKNKKAYDCYGLFLGEFDNMKDFFEEYPDGQAIDINGWAVFHKEDIFPYKKKIKLTFEL